MNAFKKYIGLLIGLIAALVYGLAFLYPIEGGSDFNLVDVHIALSIGLVYLLMALCVGFFIYKVIGNPQLGIKFGIGLLLVTVLGFIAYSTASNDLTELGDLTQQIPTTQGQYQLVGGMIILTAILIAAGVLALIGFTIKRMIDNAAS